jgi:hypothetical protein
LLARPPDPADGGKEEQEDGERVQGEEEGVQASGALEAMVEGQTGQLSDKEREEDDWLEGVCEGGDEALQGGRVLGRRLQVSM